MATVTKTDNKKKTLIAVGLGAAGLGALYFLSRGGTQTQTGELSGTYGTFGGFSSEGGIVDPGISSLATQPSRDTGTDINALLEGINNLNNQQAERQAALMNDYYTQAFGTPTQTQAQAAGSANDELADRVSNPVGSATKLSDLQKALQGYDVSDDSYRNYMKATYGKTPDAMPGAIYQQATGGGWNVASFTGEAMGSNAVQPTGREAKISVLPSGDINVTGIEGSLAQIYSPSGELKTSYTLAPSGSKDTTTTPVPYAPGKAPTSSGTTTAKTQSGGTAQVSHSAPASSTATTAPTTSSPASGISSIVSNVASGISSAVSSISSFFGGLFK